MTTTIGSAVEDVEHNPTTNSRALVKQYQPEFSVVLPSHINGEAWIRRAAGALRKGKLDGRGPHTQLEVAAMNNPAALVNAFREAAGLGLTPGTDEYYLTPRKVGGRLEILGITGYQGYIELMYRAGAISSVIVECVYSGDKFSYTPGRDDRPLHEIDWDAENRGTLRLAYAYAIMKDGAVSKVVVLNQHDIKRIKKSATAADSEYSPWTTNPESMWLKSAARQLRKWVPTSAEYITQQLRAAKAAEHTDPMANVPAPPMAPVGVEAEETEVVEAELVDPGDVRTVLPDDFDQLIAAAEQRGDVSELADLEALAFDAGEKVSVAFARAAQRRVIERAQS